MRTHTSKPTRLFKRLAQAGAALLLILVVAVAINTARQGSRQLDVAPAPAITVNEPAVIEALAGAVRLRTIADRKNPDASADQFRQFHEFLAQRFPRVHATLKRETVSNYSLLYTWEGTDKNAKPIALMAHQDVVPIAPGTESNWQEAPFDGIVKDGFVWGRGAWDDKSNLVSQLSAIEQLITEGFQPRQTIYLVFGHDEEVGGTRGAAEVVKVLQQRGVKLDFVIDEGLLITEGVMPGLDKPVALIGIAEKGYLSVELKATATPGHSSMPSQGEGAITMMSATLRRLDGEQLPAGLRGVAREMFETIAPEMSGFQRVALSNLWLLGPVVQRQLEKKASTNAMLRTTTALTVVHAGEKDNVLPGEAHATVNFRLLPGDTREHVMAHVKSKAGDGFELVALPGSAEPSPISPTQSPSYQLLNQTVRSLFPGTVVAPGLMIGATDSRHFAPISEHIYRFSPVRAKPEDLPRFHGTNERISTANLMELVRFYHQLIRNASQ
ncbi:MAG: M20 family peptidase [Pseudomonadota bacterium]